MLQATITDHLLLEELPPLVISFLSDYPPSERSLVAKKLLVYAVKKLEQRSERQQNPTRQYYQLPTWWAPDHNKENKRKDKKHSTLPIEEQLSRRMNDGMTQTSDAYIRAPEKVSKGTRGYQNFIASKSITCLTPRLFYLQQMINLFPSEKKRFIPICSSSEPSNHDIIPSENEDDVKNYNMRNKDPFFVASTKKPTTYEHLKKPQQTKDIRHPLRTRQIPTQTNTAKPSIKGIKTGKCFSNTDNHQPEHTSKHKQIAKLQSLSKSSPKDNFRARSKIRSKNIAEIADEFLESNFMAYIEPPHNKDDSLENNEDLEEIIYKARQKTSV
ncbi:284_t:CDS:2 [Funneliformis caledonium]|uniref:284_t:CDS:1 n=1 Tax=Funneliformis caledonium TaxID=1117310 RepID=A0A9N8VUQ9_9GLOM|nr:284_t:CDS:2 [Funneliformis caledonium]